MDKIHVKFDKAVTTILIAIAMVIVTMQCLGLIWELGKVIMERVQVYGLNYVPEQGHNVAVLFFNILLMLEIMETVRTMHREHHVKIKVILIVCLIAVSRKILSLEIEHPDPMMDFAMAALVLALALGYYFISRSGKTEETESK